MHLENPDYSGFQQGQKNYRVYDSLDIGVIWCMELKIFDNNRYLFDHVRCLLSRYDIFYYGFLKHLYTKIIYNIFFYLYIYIYDAYVRICVLSNANFNAVYLSL